MMDLISAQKTLEQVLSICKISTVYYIDDFKHQEYLAQVQKFIEETSVEELELLSPKVSDEVIIAKKADAPIDTLVQNWWQELSLTDQTNVLDGVCKSFRPSIETVSIKLLGDCCICCTPEEWEAKYREEYLEKHTSGETVFLLFDKMLQNKSTLNEEERGIQLAEAALNGIKDNSVFCGIFSQQFNPEDEFEERKKYKYDIYPISKKRLNVDNYSSFVEGIINVLWVGDIEILKKGAIKVIEKASTALINRYSDIQPAEYRQIIVNSSRKEGCRELDTMMRLIHIVFDTEVRRSFSELQGDDYRLLLESADRISSMKELCPQRNQAPVYNKDLVKRFNKDECYISDNVLNKLLSPLENGDVFKVNDDRYYILLCQPCNISLRPFGGRRKENDEYDIGFWVPLIENAVSHGKLDKKLQELDTYIDVEHKPEAQEIKQAIRTLFDKSFKQPLPCMIEGKELSADISHFTTVSLSILDNTTFNEAGTLIIGDKNSDKLHPIQRELAKKHSLSHFNPDEISSRLKVFCEECEWEKLSLEEGEVIRAKIKRIGHLRDPFGEDLLVQLSHYISRLGLPNAFV